MTPPHRRLVTALAAPPHNSGKNKKAQLMPLTVRANHETAYLRGIHEAYKEIVKWIVHRR